MKRTLFTICVFGLLAGTTAAQDVSRSTLQETTAFLAAKPELQKWFDDTCKHLRKELGAIVTAIDAVEDPTAFGIGKPTEGKMPDPEELKKRKTQARKAVLEYSENCERHLLALLTAARLKDLPCVQQRVVATPLVSLALLPKDDPTRTAYIEPEKGIEENGKRTVQAQKMSLSSRTLLPVNFPKTFTHELAHAFLQGRNNMENRYREKELPTNAMVDLAALRYPLYRYKENRFIDKELIAEGITELLTQQALDLLGINPSGVTYQFPIGCSLLMMGCDDAAVMEWYTGSITTEECWIRLRRTLAEVLQSKEKFSKEEAERVAFGLVNLLLDNRNRKEFHQVRGDHAEFSIVMHSIIRALIEAGVNVETHMRKTDIPANVAALFFKR